MGAFILRGISAALLVTLLTLAAGIGWNRFNLGVLSIAQLVDIGLLASCLVGGYWTARASGRWFWGGIVGAGYVAVGTLLLALFLPIQVWGFVQLLGEGALVGCLAGALGARGEGRRQKNTRGRWSLQIKSRKQSGRSYADVDDEKEEEVTKGLAWAEKESGRERWNEALPVWEQDLVSEEIRGENTGDEDLEERFGRSAGSLEAWWEEEKKA